MDVLGQHNPYLVALSVVVACVASYTALDLGSRMRASEGASARYWHLAAALAMGGGIWSTHVVGMMAMELPASVTFDPWTTGLSLLLAVVLAGFGFSEAARGRGTRWGLVAGGGLMAAGIVAMHYVGIESLDIQGRVLHDPVGAATAVFVAAAAAVTAVRLSEGERTLVWRLVSSGVMGSAVAGMHYMGMAGTTFVCAPGAAPASDAQHAGLAVAVAATTLTVLFLGIVASIFDKRFASLAAREAQALRESEERFRQLYRRTPLPLHALDPEGRVVQVSDAWLSLLGYARDEVLGRRLTDFMDPDSARRRAEADWPHLLGAGSIVEREARFLRRSGEAVDVLLSADVEIDAAGAFVRSLEGIVDVTRRNEAEQALRQAQKMEAVGQLTGGIAHDFNNLLMVVSGGLGMIERGRQTPRLIDGMRQSIERATGLTKQLLTFSRRQAVKPEVADLAVHLPRLRTMLVHSLRPGIELSLSAEHGLWRTEVDAGEMELAILNLVVNARDAMPGGGALRVEARNEVLDGRNPAGLRGEYVAVIVSDTGVGMDADTVARAFEPFFTTKEPGKGTGLGLSQVYGFARQSGGGVTVRSRPGEGASFTVHLPRTTKPVRAEDEAQPRAARAAEDRGLVLLVEDTPQVADMATAMLHELGYEVVHAGGAEEALGRLAEGDGFCAVLSDIVMGGPMSGIDLGRAVRRRYPGLPVLLSTGYYRELDGSAAREFAILRKPYRIEDLDMALERVQGPSAAPDRLSA